ncbi:twin-arginine translocation signal domain-containing protein [Pontiellaceae bacterium B12227]|nr:twin-arginine translocation signal domain-containing protein [Pontiellaceae bacterium B12227]
MTIELNRRTFLALIGVSAAAAGLARPSDFKAPPRTNAPGTPRCFLDGVKTELPARPKTAAITYLSE